VTAASSGSYINSLPANALQTSNGNNSTPAVATLTVVAPVNAAPTLSKMFSPSSVIVNGASLLTITMNNPNGTPALLTFPLTDHLPIGVMIAGTANTTCGGVVTATMGGTTVTQSGGSIPANGSCKVTVNVSGKCVGNYYNSLAAGALQTSNGNNTGPAVATLTINPAPIGEPAPVLRKYFWPQYVTVGEASTLTIVLKNGDETTSKLTSALVDTFPSGMTIMGSATNSCGGTLTAVKGGSSLSLSGGSIPASGSCKITVKVSANKLGKFFNLLKIGALQTTTGSNTSAAGGTLTVNTTASSGPTLSKSFYPSSVRSQTDCAAHGQLYRWAGSFRPCEHDLWWIVDRRYGQL